MMKPKPPPEAPPEEKPKERSLVFKVMVGLVLFIVIFGFLGAIAKSIESGPLNKLKKLKKEPKASARRQPRPEMAEKSNRRLGKGG